MRMVAKRRCGDCSNLRMFLSVLRSLSSSSFIACGSIEKKATSEADISAERASNTIQTVKDTMADSNAGVVK